MVSDRAVAQLGKWMRRSHRWLSIVFTVAVIINIGAVWAHAYSAGTGLLAVVPIFLLLITGLYLFVLPYAVDRRRLRTERNDRP